jgi:hypothetical protein
MSKDTANRSRTDYHKETTLLVFYLPDAIIGRVPKAFLYIA